MAEYERVRTSDGRPLSSIDSFKSKGVRKRIRQLKELPEWAEPVSLTITLIDRLNHPEEEQEKVLPLQSSAEGTSERSARRRAHNAKKAQAN